MIDSLCLSKVHSMLLYFCFMGMFYSSLRKCFNLSVCVCGNHDVGNRPTKDTIENYKSTFGDDYFSFWFGGVHFIVLNSQLYEDYSLVEDHAVAQDKWLGMIVTND